MILGLSLIQRAVLAARRAGYAQVFLLGRKWPRRDRGRRRSPIGASLAATLSSQCGAADHCARRHPRGNRLARAAGLDADRAGRLGGHPEPNRHARRRVGLGCGGRAG